MTLSPQLSFGRSEFDAFLFASLGEDKAGIELTVLSALARLGFDPWGEAARLSNLPRETAAQVLATTIALLPVGNWKAADTRDIAVRLVDYLPRRSISPVSSPRGKHTRKAKAKSEPAIWLICVVAAIGWFFAMSYLETDRPFEPVPSLSTQQ